jgi:hypothetical protein
MLHRRTNKVVNSTPQPEDSAARKAAFKQKAKDASKKLLHDELEAFRKKDNENFLKLLGLVEKQNEMLKNLIETDKKVHEELVPEKNESNDKAKYRIITSDQKIKYAGTDEPSWLTLEDAKTKVDISAGEMIYEFDKNGNRLYEIL